MSGGKFIDFHLGMKYDLSNSIKNLLLQSFHEYKKKQIDVRNYLLLSNKKEIEQDKELKITLIKDANIYKFKEKSNKVCIIDSWEENHIPKGYYCYPLKGAYFQKSSLDVPFFPSLPFDKFKEAIETFSDQTNLSETYQSYPCLPEEDFNRIKRKIINKYNNIYDNKPIFKDIFNKKNTIVVRPSHCTNNINKYFIIWSFIKIFNGQSEIMDKDLYKIYKIDENKIIIPIINEMNKHLKIDVNILYYIIINFLNDLSIKINKNNLSERGITYKKYEKYWCRICNKFCCAFHFKVKLRTLELDNKNIRTYTEHFKKIQIIMKPPEYLFKEKKENDKNKQDLKFKIEQILKNCPCKNQSTDEDIESIDYQYINNEDKNEIENAQNNNNQISILNSNFIFDPSERYNKMAEIENKEDFFIFCKIIKTCHKLLCKKFDGLYTNQEIFNFYLTPCVLRKILHNKYECNLMQYLIKLLIEEEYLKDINFFLTTTLGNNITYENLKEENYLFFNNSNELNFQPRKNNNKNEKDKKTNFIRTKATARLQIQSKRNLYYKPCDHYPSECTKENCPCVKEDGLCLKYCCCFKETKTKASCNNTFVGCRHINHTKTNCKDCVCKQNYIECVPGLCNCGEKCTNNNITLGKRKKLLFGFSERINGGGLFAGEKILQGEFIDSYDGEIVEKDELDRLSVFYDQTGNNYPFCINNKFDFVTIKTGGLTRYINHGSFGEQNIEADKIMVNGIPYIAFYAFRDIAKYEELFYDYSYDENSMPDWMKEYNKMMEIKIKKQEEIMKNNESKINKIHPKKKGYHTNKKKDEKKKNEEYRKAINNDNFINLEEEEY